MIQLNRKTVLEDIRTLNPEGVTLKLFFLASFYRPLGCSLLTSIDNRHTLHKPHSKDKCLPFWLSVEIYDH